MPADLASAAAAVLAAWTKTQLDRGASASPRYSTRFEKHLTQQAGASGGPVRADGQSNASAVSQLLSASKPAASCPTRLVPREPLPAAQSERVFSGRPPPAPRLTTPRRDRPSVSQPSLRNLTRS